MFAAELASALSDREVCDLGAVYFFTQCRSGKSILGKIRSWIFQQAIKACLLRTSIVEFCCSSIIFYYLVYYIYYSRSKVLHERFIFHAGTPTLYG